MEPAGDARRPDDLEQPGIVADVIRPKTLAHIGVEIDLFGHAASSLRSATAALAASLPGKAMKVRFLSAGDRALVVEFGDRVDRRLSERVLRLDAIIRSNPPPGIVETVPTFRSLAVYYDPLLTSRGELQRAITPLLDLRDNPRTGAKLWQVPVCYEGEFAPDLAEVARLTGLTPNDVVALHSGTRFHVYMLGFLPGFPYMGDLPSQLALPRRADPRLRVPAGSISIATSLTAIYPYESPGGWHLIGATPIRMFDPERSEPALFAPGDAVRFEPIDAAEFAAIRKAVDTRSYDVESAPVAL
jgi:KipI family sensor histidine kinase inhibitor